MAKVTLRNKMNILMDRNETFPNKNNTLVKAAYETEIPEVRAAILVLANAYAQLEVVKSQGVKWVEPSEIWSSIPHLKSNVIQAIKNTGEDIPEWQLLAERYGWTPPSSEEAVYNKHKQSVDMRLVTL